MSILNVENLTTTEGILLPSYTTGNYPNPVTGKVIFDSTINELRVYNGSSWVGLLTQYYADILIVGGGGGGGASFGGGGGGGGVKFFRGYPLTIGQSFTVTVAGGGGGGSGPTDAFGLTGQSGGNSRFGCHYAAGGGGGGGRGPGANWGDPATPGGSGGGGGHSDSSPRTIMGEGIPGQGHYGGWGKDTTSGGYASGGGGGAVECGQDARGSNIGGKGGDGAPYDISGSVVYYAAGGGGGVYTSGSGGAGGVGGGGTGGRYAQAGQLTTGSPATGYGSGGGGGGYTYNGGDGSNGIIIIRYAGSQRGTGGSVSTSGGYTRHTFNTTGTFTFTA